MSTTEVRHIYAVYLTALTATQPVGTVVNHVVWAGNGTGAPADETALVLDENRGIPDRENLHS
ncbi:hypothetical protein JK191_13185 [Gluconobacter sphaericus]|uniref:hypothetical protein n=1 Tax=Gluconobacter sphaericus TaxID=574987 RepID=UPI001B8A999D|nr:hypothetical protein [Gluconobacter sphaericus]MBS1098486.1 hypothetical protein [Gluconobacter sphaericus]